MSPRGCTHVDVQAARQAGDATRAHTSRLPLSLSHALSAPPEHADGELRVGKADESAIVRMTTSHEPASATALATRPAK
eukprot:4726157-Prymnesium_polylepis.2